MKIITSPYHRLVNNMSVSYILTQSIRLVSLSLHWCSGGYFILRESFNFTGFVGVVKDNRCYFRASHWFLWDYVGLFLWGVIPYLGGILKGMIDGMGLLLELQTCIEWVDRVIIVIVGFGNSAWVVEFLDKILDWLLLLLVDHFGYTGRHNLEYGIACHTIVYCIFNLINLLLGCWLVFFLL